MGYEPPEFVVEKFVDEVKKRVAEDEFRFLCRMAKSGRMGFGKDEDDWGSFDLQAG